MLANRIRNVFGVEMPLVSIFDDPTVAGLVERVAEWLGENTAKDEVASEARESRD